MSDIIDRIDQLVDEQMAGGEPRQGYDFNDPQYPRCPHCERHWHGLPITERIAQMYSFGAFDDEYRVDQDDTPVLCHGSEFIGPMPSPPVPGWRSRWRSGTPVPWLDDLIGATEAYVCEALGAATGIRTSTRMSGLLEWPAPYLPVSIRGYTWLPGDGEPENRLLPVPVGNPTQYLGPFDALATAMMGAAVPQFQLLADASPWVWERLPRPAGQQVERMIWRPPTFTPFDADGNVQLDGSWQVVGTLQEGIE
jgi:hypothetical protein